MRAGLSCLPLTRTSSSSSLFFLPPRASLPLKHQQQQHRHLGHGLRPVRRVPIKLKMTTGCKIAVLGDLKAPHMAQLSQLPPEAEIVASGTKFEDFGGAESALASADVLLTAPPCGRALMEQLWPLLPNLKWVHCLFAGLDHLLFPALVEGPVILTNAKGLFSSSLAEYAIMSMGYFAKDVPRLNRQKASCQWEKYSVKELKGATLGIIGYGDIGMATARLAKAYGMKVIALRRRPAESSNDVLVDTVLGTQQLPELMSSSDYVLVAAALTPETRGMVNAAAFSHSKADQVLINLGRGPLVDEAALLQALGDGTLKGAALDVFDQEPLPSDHPLWHMPNVLLSPHNADQTETFLHDSVSFFTANAVRYVRGHALHNLVDKNAGY